VLGLTGIEAQAPLMPRLEVIEVALAGEPGETTRDDPALGHVTGVGPDGVGATGPHPP
jgi:hypothetical protein